MFIYFVEKIVNYLKLRMKDRDKMVKVVRRNAANKRILIDVLRRRKIPILSIRTIAKARIGTAGVYEIRVRDRDFSKLRAMR